MPKLFPCVALAVSVAAAGAVAQGGAPFGRFPAPSPIYLDGAGGPLPAGAASPSRLVRFVDPDVGILRQDPDYSLSGLFQQSHGDFMIKRQRFDPQIEFRGQAIVDAKVDGEPGRFEMVRGIADIDLPLTVSPDGFILIGGVFDMRRYQVKNMAPFADENLYQIGVKAGFGLFLDPDILFEASVVPSIFSDLDGTLHHKDFDFPAEALLTWRTTPDFFFKIGARYNEIYDEAQVLPYLGFAFAVNPEWRIDVLLPEMVEVSWWPDPGFGFLLGVEIQGAQYRVRTNAATGSQQDDVKVQEIIPYVGMMYRPSDYVAFYTRVGAVVAGDYKLTDGTAGANIVDGTLEPALFLEVGFGFDF